MKAILVATAAAALGAVALAAPVPSFPTQYSLWGTITLPYANITEPFMTHYDGVNNMQRVEYYEGLDTYITRGDLAAMYQVNPVVSSFQCFETDGAINVTSYFPDLTGFTYAGPAVVLGHQAGMYTYVNTVGSKVNTYNFYVDASTGTPLQYHWLGYDELFGSHYDEYVIVYTNFVAGNSLFNTTTFAKPAMSCGQLDGEGYDSPAFTIASMFPDTSDAVDNHFNAYTKNHGKDYKPNEADERQLYFTKNVRFVHMANRMYRSQGSSLVLAVNAFADHSPQELSKRSGVNARTRRAFNGAHAVHPVPASLSDLPASVNWTAQGAVTPVKDQGICGSCWSFGTAETLEGANFVKTGNLVELSQQELMDCSWPYGNNACDGGEDFLAYQWIMQNGGLAKASDYGPYLMADGFCRANSTASTVQITGYVNVTSESEAALQSAVATIGPISVAIDASHLSLSFYSSGVYYEPTCSNDPADLDHAVLAVGYGTESDGDYWIVKNSWSTHWGNNGYVLMARNRGNNCGIATAATYVQV